MSFGREKRLLLGWLAGLAPLPLPLNDILEWSFVLAYWMAVAVFLFRASEGTEEWLPTWALNVIGLVYLPVLYLDFTRFFGGQVLRPLIHLAGFALIVKLFALQRERDKWHALIGIFFLFLAAMGTSVHPAVLLYLVAFMALTITALMRFAAYHFLSDFREPASVFEDARTRGFLIFSTLATVLLGAMIFPVLPRVGTPFISTSGSGGGQRAQSSGFSNVMSLDGIGRIRLSDEVALRVRYESAPPAQHEMRFKGATYDLFRGDSWRRAPMQPQRLQPGAFGLFHLRRGDPQSWVDIWQEPMGLRNIFMPGEAVSLEVRYREIGIDEGGAVFARQRHMGPLEYRVSLGRRPQSLAVEPAEGDTVLDLTGVTPEMRALAERVMGEGSVAERVKRLERHLVQQYEYTLDLMGRTDPNPIQSFLFEDKRGHCEYFASAMVLLLRSQGIPARLVTGFLGAERPAIENFYMIRQSNAHAWVEAFVPDSGWTVYEPTPPSGRPVVGEASMWGTALQAYDYLVFRWDRYILSFGASDQVGFFSRLREAWNGARDFLFGESTPQSETIAAAPAEDQMSGKDRREGLQLPRGWWVASIGLALVLGFWAWMRRPAFDARRAYRLLRRRARRRGLDLPDSVAPGEVGERVKRMWPAAADAVDPIVARYLEESFGGRPIDAAEAEALKERLREASGVIGKAA